MVLNKQYQVKITKNAEQELIEIYEYISGILKSEIAANNFVKQIEEKINRLYVFPYSCMEVKTKPRNTIYRKLYVKNYLLLYKVLEENQRVDIIHIYYGRRDYLVKKRANFLEKISSFCLQKSRILYIIQG